MHLVQLLLPLYDGRGRRIPRVRFAELAEELTLRHGGLTAYVRTPATGLWRPRRGGRIHRDDVVIYEVMVKTLQPSWWAALRRRLEETGVTLYLEHEVRKIVTSDSAVVGVEVRRSDGSDQTLGADYVVSNMEVVPAMRRLLGSSERALKKMQRWEPSCSGIVLHLGLDRIYPQLRHHNFFYSHNQHAHFNRVFREKKLPDDPTIYLVAPTRSDPSQAPSGCDNIKILPHIPYLNERNPYTREDYAALKELCLDKLERMGLEGLRRHIVVEDFWTPFDIESRYGSNCGSIYGVVCDRRKNFAFKAPRRSAQYRNLYFVGGSVNPGGGMPMVVLSGQHVAHAIAEQDGEMP